MLTDTAIDKLMQPIIDRQEDINTYVLQLIARRIHTIGRMSPSDLRKLETLYFMGSDIRELNATLADYTALQVNDIKAMIKEVALDSYIDAKPFYDYRHKSYIPFEQNRSLQQLVTAIGNETAETYRNLANSHATGFLISDKKHPQILRFMPIENTYNRVMDEAIQAVVSGTLDFNVAMRRTVNQLVDSGIRKIYWDSGYTQRVDSAVRRNLLGGIKKIHMETEALIGKEIGADGVELSVHYNSAPDHEPIQGHQFTNEEFENLQSDRYFEDVKGNKFDAIPRAIGTWNCRHFTSSIIVGVTKPRFSDSQLSEIMRLNAQGFDMPNGKHLTMYECTQRQRMLETKIREAKDGQNTFRTSGDKKEAKKYQARVNKYLTQYEAFSKACGLKMKRDRISVHGYRKIKV